MKELIIAAALALIPISASAMHEPAQYQLKNGMRIIVSEDHRFPLVSTRLRVRAGSAWETRKEAGISHFIEHMVFKGSKTSPPEGVSEAVEKAGGDLNAYTSYDETVYENNLPSREWKLSLASMRDLCFDAALRHEDVDAEREVVLAEKSQRGDNPMVRLLLRTGEIALRGTPYEAPVIGYEDSLRGQDPAMLRDYMERFYDPGNMALFVSGDVDPQAVFRECEALFGPYENKAGRLEHPPVPLKAENGVELQKGPWQKAYIDMSFPMPQKSDRRTLSVQILADILGDDDTNAMIRRFRYDSDLAESLSVIPMTYERAGLLHIMAVTSGENAAAYVDEMLRFLAGMDVSAISDEQIARAKFNEEDSLVRATETVAGRAEFLVATYAIDPADLTGDNYVAKIRAVDRASLGEVMNGLIVPERLFVTALLPEDCSLSEDHVKDAVAAMPRKLPQSGEDQITGGEAKVMRFGSDSLVMQKDDSYPYAAVTIKFKGGESARIDDAEGIAGLAAAVLTEAVEGMDNKALSAWLSDRAASVSASSEYLDFSVSFFCPARFSGELFALLGNMLEKPAFAGEDFERVRRDALASLGMLRENAGSYLGYELSPFLYPNHVYGRRLKGTTKSLPSITLGQVKAFWAKQLTMPFTLSAAGVFDEKDAAALAQRLSARTAADAPDVSAPEWNDDKKLALSLPGRDQEYALMLFPTVPVDHPDSPGIELLSECLGGFTGPLFQELREKRSLGYSAFPMNRSSQYSGFLAFGAVTSPAHEQAVFEQYPLIAARLAHDPLPSEQVEAAKRRIAFGHDSARQSLAHRASSAAHYALWGKPLDFPEERLRKMETMSPEDLKALAAKYLVPEKSYMVTVKP